MKICDATIIDDETIDRLKKYAPAALDALRDEINLVSHWGQKADVIDALEKDGYQPLALLIHGFVFGDWNKELAELRYALSKIEESLCAEDQSDDLCQRTAMLSMRSAHNMRHARVEKLLVVFECVKKAIKDGKLTPRHGIPPYFPLANNRRFCFDTWLNEDPIEKVGQRLPFWQIFPDLRIVAKISEIDTWLLDSGVSSLGFSNIEGPKIPANQINPSGMKKNGQRFGTQRQRTRILEAVSKLYDPKLLPDSSAKMAVREIIVGINGPSGMITKSQFDKRWQELLDRDLIGYQV